MANIIDSYFCQHKELSDFLLEKKEISLKSDSDRRFAKVLVLACASYFEDRIISAISLYCNSALNGNEKIINLLRVKAFDRQYHSLFAWKENNANRFFSHFGEDISKKHKNDMSKNNEIKQGERMFMTIGQMRNVLVHSNFAVASITETHEEIYEMFNRAIKFVEYIESIFLIDNQENGDTST